MMNYIAIGRIIRDLRKSKGMTPSELSVDSGIPYLQICSIENGKKVELGLTDKRHLEQSLGLPENFLDE